MIDIAALEVARDAIRETRPEVLSGIVEGETRAVLVAELVRALMSLTGTRAQISFNDVADVEVLRSEMLAAGCTVGTPYVESTVCASGDDTWIAASVSCGDASFSLYSKVRKLSAEEVAARDKAARKAKREAAKAKQTAKGTR